MRQTAYKTTYKTARFFLIAATCAITAAPALAQNFTYVPRGGAVASPVQPQPQQPAQIPPGPYNVPPAFYQQAPLSGDPARSGGGQDFDSLPAVVNGTRSGQGENTTGRNTTPASPPAIYSNVAPNPAAPPQGSIWQGTRSGVAGAMQMATPTVDLSYTQDGQIFHGITSMPQQPGFYTVVAHNQAEFATIWQQHIGLTPPKTQLAPGQVAVFATSGPKYYTGYDVNLKLLPDDSDGTVRVLATAVSPSPTVEMARADISPWRMLIVNPNGHPVEVVAHKSLTGSRYE